MGYETERTAIYSHFQTQWGSTTPVQWENQPFDPPASGPWVKVSILRGQSQAAGILLGGRSRGPAAQIDVMHQVNQGLKTALDLVDQITTVFRGKRIQGIQFEGPSVQRIDEPETSRLRIVTSIPFYRDESFSIT